MTVKGLAKGVAEHWDIGNLEIFNDNTELFVQLPPLPGRREPQIFHVRDLTFTYLSASRNRIATEAEHDAGDTRSAFLLEC